MSWKPPPPPGGSSGGTAGGWKPPPAPGSKSTSTTRPVSLDTVGQNVANLHRTSGGSTQSARTYKKKKKKAAATADSGGIFGELGDLVSSLPTGIYHAAEGAIHEATHQPTIFSPGDRGETTPDPLGHVVHGFTGDTSARERADNPISTMQGGSFRNTYEDAIHPTRFVQAYQDGHLIGKLVEDAANVSVVAGIAGGTLNAAAKGSLADATNAATAAKAAEKGIEPVEAEATRLAKIADGHEAEVAKIREALDAAPHKAKGPLRTELTRAEDMARRTGREAADQANAAATWRQNAEAARATADRLDATASGPLSQAYRIAHATAHLTGQGANLPAKPFELASKLFSTGLTKFLGENPGVRDALVRADESLGDAMAIREPGVRTKILNARDRVKRGVVHGATAALNSKERRELSGRVRTVEGKSAEDAVKLDQANRAIDRITGGDEAVFQTGVLHREGVGQALAEPFAAMERVPGGAERLKAIVDELAQRRHYDPQAFYNAIEVARGTADPALTEQVRSMNAVWDQRLAPWFEATVGDETQGRRRSLSPDEEAYNDWNLSQTAELDPGTTSRLQRLERRMTEKRTRKLAEAEAEVAKKADKAGVTPGARGATAERQAAATANEGNSGRGSIGSLRKVQEQARSEGRAAGARSAVERIQAVRDAIPGQVDDATITRIVDASDRFQRATEALHTAQGEAALATPGAAPSPAELIKRVRDVRATVTDVARSELDTFADLPTGSLPFVPGDLSEYHAQLHEGIAGRETSVLDRFEKMRQAPANRRLPDEAVFVKAYRQAWNKLPAALKNTLVEMDDAAVREMFGRYRAGTLSEMAGGLDTLATEYLGDRASGVAQQDVEALIGEYARKGQVEAFLSNAKGNRWGDHMPDLLRAVIHDPEVARLLDDPMVDLAMRSERLDSAATGLSAMEAQTAAAPLELPEAGSIERASADLGDPDITNPETAMAVIERAFGGNPEKTSAFYDRWQAAGSPPLEDAMLAIDDGERPPWADEGGTSSPATAGDTGQVGGLEALRGQEAARSEIEQVVATRGGQAVDEQLGREVGVLNASAKRSEASAAAKSGAEGEAIESLTSAGARKGVKGGKRLAEYEKAMRGAGIARRKLDAIPDDMAAEVEKLYADASNAPAHTQSAVKTANEFTKAITDWRSDLVDAGVTDDLLAPFDEALTLAIKDVRDIYGQKIANADGTLSPAPPAFETQYVPGGQPLRKREEALGLRSRSKVDQMSTRKAAVEKKKETTLTPRNTTELREIIRERLDSTTRNAATRMVADIYGGTKPEQLLGDVSELDDKQLGQAMAAKGYEAWDPESIFQGVKSNAKAGDPGVLWLPEHIKRSVDSYYAKGGYLERFMRRYYDKPITFWKAAVLALRPAWHVNNILSNALMAMVGSGMDPITYARRMRQSFALLKLPDQALDVSLPEGVVRTGPFAAAREARAANPARLARTQRIVDSIEPHTLEALGSDTGPSAPTRIVEGKAGAAMLQPEDLRKSESVIHPERNVDQMMKEPGRLKRFIDGSYTINGAVDDANRLAVYLDQSSKLTRADLANLVGKHPEMARMTMSQLRSEAAVRQSLRIAGDFTRMSPVERQVFRRIFPFYVWMRHITGLTAHLVAYHPLRVAWGLHVAQMFGTPEEFGLASAIPLGPNSVLQSPTVVPFGDSVQTLPTPSSPDNLAREIGFSLSPVAKVGAGALFGMDLNRWSQFQRPPGEPGGYGGSPATTPLLFAGRFGELGNLAANQFPQTRALRGITDTLDPHLPTSLQEGTGGRPVQRYPLGQVRRTSKTAGRKPQPSGEPTLGPLARYLGLPYLREPSQPFESADVKAQLAELKKRKKKSGRR